MAISASKGKGMDHLSNQKEKLLPILVSRTVIFFFLMCIITIFLYLAGTIQGFIDSTQLFLLRLYTVLGIFLSVVSIVGMILNLQRLFRTKKTRYLLRAGVYILMVLFGAATVLAVMFIITVSEGTGV